MKRLKGCRHQGGVVLVSLKLWALRIQILWTENEWVRIYLPNLDLIVQEGVINAPIGHIRNFEDVS